MTDKYEDIIHLPHPTSKKHPRMSLENRAAQFAPFAALTGYDAMVGETARLTDARADLDEEQMLALNETLSVILERINEHPKVCVTWFRKDAVKDGGAYMRTEGTVRDVELSGRLFVFREGERIPLDDIVSIAIMPVEG